MRMSMRIRSLGVVALLATSGVAWAQLFGGGDVAARVNGEAITLTEVKAVLDARPQQFPVPKEQEREHRKLALQMLIDDVLMRQFFLKNVQKPSPGEVEKVVDELKDALKKQNKTLDLFLREEKQTETQLRNDITTDLQWKIYLNQRYSEAETKAYFDTHKPFFEKVQVRASHILVKMPATLAPAERDKLKGQLEVLRTHIMNKQFTFEEAARKWSDCPSKEKGGDLGFFTYKFMVVEPFARAAFATQPGGITGVVPSEFGLHLIKVVERTPPEPADYNTIKDIVRKTIAQDQDLFRQILTQQRNVSKIDVLMQ
jgi:peptidyl-prolyl cis-trans isomerase C